MRTARLWRSSATIVSLPSVAALALGLLASGGAAQAASAGLALVQGTQPGWVSGATDVGSASASSSLTTRVYLAGDSAGLAAYARAVSAPGNPAYQHFLSPAEVNARYGATASQAAAVENWLRGSGLTVRRVSWQEIDATGTVAGAEHAYGTTLNDYKTAAGTFRAPASDARIPASVGHDVLGIAGLDNRPQVVRPASLVQTGPVRTERGTGPLPESAGSDGSPFLGPTPCSTYYGQQTDTTDPPINGGQQPYAICGYVPGQLRGAYGLRPAETGKGITVAITDAYAAPTLQADANTYAANHGGSAFAAGQFTETTNPATWTDEVSCGGPAGWASEQALDIEAVHAMAPGADIHYYGANSCNDTDFIAVLTSIVNTRSANVVTDSWGEVIYSATGDEPAATVNEYTQLFQRGVAEGIEFVFSAGDCGAEDPATACGADDTSTTEQADFPSSDPYVTSAGGTSTFIGRNNNYLGAVPWGDDASVLESGSWNSVGWIYGGGGGTSAVFSQPWYQKGVVPAALARTLPDGSPVSQAMRVTPDVSMDADPFTGFLIGETQVLPDGTTGYAESDIGGTSLAAPLFAGLVADGEQSHVLPKGFVNPALYLEDRLTPWAFHDITEPASAAATPYNILPAFEGDPAIAIEMGDDQWLKATPGYDDATGIGTPAALFQDDLLGWLAG
jgi:subtilase family serine protease